MNEISVKGQSDKRILLYCNWGVYCEANKIHIPSIHLRYLIALEKLGYNSITLISKVSPSLRIEQDTFISNEKINVIPLPWFEGYSSAIKYFSHLQNSFRVVSENSYDRVFIRIWEPFAWLLVLRFYMFDKVFTKKNVTMHFLSEPLSAIKGNSKYSALQKLLRYILFLPEYYITLFVSRLCRATSNGPLPINTIPKFFSDHYLEVIDSALLEKDLPTNPNAVRYDGGVVKLLYVGFIRYGKGIHFLLEGFRNLNHSDQKYKLTIIGVGDALEYCKSYVKKNGLENLVTFEGYVPFSDSLFEYYKSHHIFVNPSLSEAGPRVLLEAKVFGNFLISTDVGYAERLIESDSEGIIIRAGSSSEISHAIQDATSRLIIDRGKTLSFEDFNHTITTEQFFQSVLNEA